MTTNKISELFLETGMTQKEFSEYLAIPLRTIENWLTGKRVPPEYLIELIEYKLEKERLI